MKGTTEDVDSYVKNQHQSFIELVGHYTDHLKWSMKEFFEAPPYTECSIQWSKTDIYYGVDSGYTRTYFVGF